MVAECEDCGAAYAAEQWSDGKIRLIGRSDCRCGEASFVVMGTDDAQKTASD